MSGKHTQELASIKLEGKAALLGVVLLLLLGGYRFNSMEDSQDPALNKVMQQVLEQDLRSEVMVDRELYDFSNSEDAEDYAALLSDPGLEILQISESKPLFSFSSDQEVIVRVRYRAFEEPELHEVYHRMRYSALFGWNHKFSSSKIGFYLNFL